MIQANELRIGNWLEYFTDIGDSLGFRQVKASEFLALYDNPKRAIPIKLTEEILLKCGFNYKDGEYIKGLWKLVPDFPKEEVVGYGLFIKRLDWTRTNENSIKYLHQLQNLYFALTGKELEVKL